MRDEAMKPVQPAPVAPGSFDADERRLVRALETVPAVTIPADFVARVVARLPAERPVSLRPTWYGRNAMLLGAAVLLVALLGLASRPSSQSVLGLAVEWTLCAQFVGLVFWLSARYRNPV